MTATAEIPVARAPRPVRRTDRRSRPPLSPAAEAELLRAAAGGNERARERLVEAFMPLVAGVARVYRNSGAVDRLELMQEGVVGLLRALERYDASRGTPFWAYASFWVRQAMQQLVAELTRPVVLSDRALRQLARVKQARREHLQEHKRDPSTADLSERTGIAREQIEHLIAVERVPRSTDERLGDDDVDTTLGELLADPTAEDEYERVERRLQMRSFGGLPSELAERELAVVSARYGLEGPEQTLRELAGTFDLSAERVRQIEERALEKLREAQLTA